MASSDFTLAMNQEILKWIFGKATLPQTIAPLHNRWLIADDATSVTPGTETIAGAPSRTAMSYNGVTYTNGSNGSPSIANAQYTVEGSLIWPASGPQTLTGNELWDASTPPRRICYDKSNFGFTVTTGDLLEWTGTSSGIALVGSGFDGAILQQALSWALGKSSGWTRPIGPFKIKLIQDEDYVNSPKSILAAAPMQTVTFGAVDIDSDNQATIRSDINVVFPVISPTTFVVVQRYEIWDSSPTPRRIINRISGDDYNRDGYSRSFAYVEPNNTLTIPLGSLKIALGRGDL